MKNLGNISGIVYTSYPCQWDEVHVCDDCKIKQTVRVGDKMPTNYLHISDYTEQANITTSKEDK